MAAFRRLTPRGFIGNKHVAQLAGRTGGSLEDAGHVDRKGQNVRGGVQAPVFPVQAPDLPVADQVNAELGLRLPQFLQDLFGLRL
jgi:hypothetical protein